MRSEKEVTEVVSDEVPKVVLIVVYVFRADEVILDFHRRSLMIKLGCSNIKLVILIYLWEKDSVIT